MSDLFEYIAAMDSFRSVMNGMDTALNKVLLDIRLLDENVIRVNDEIGRWKVSFHDTAEYAPTPYYLEHNVASSSTTQGEDEGNRSLDTEDHLIETASSLGKIAKSGLALYETFEKLPPVLEKVKTGIGIFDEAVNAFGGIEALTSATGFAEATESISTIMAAAEGIATAGVGLGPAGWIAGTVALAAGGLTVLAISENNRRINEISTFGDEAIKNENPYVLGTESLSARSESYVKQTEALDATSPRHADKMRRLKNDFLGQSVIHFDYKKAQSKDSTYLQGLVEALIENDHLANQQIKQVLFDDVSDLNYFRKKFDVLGHFPLKTKDKIPQRIRHYEPGMGETLSRWVDDTIYVSPKEYDNQHEKNVAGGLKDVINKFSEQALNTIVKAYLLDGYDYVQKEYKSKLQMFGNSPGTVKKIEDVWKRFLGTKDVIDHDRSDQGQLKKSGQYRAYLDRSRNETAGNGRIVNININKPLIGQFTINTKETKEGLTAFKHKVEEVLIEILNGANVI